MRYEIIAALILCCAAAGPAGAGEFEEQISGASTKSGEAAREVREALSAAKQRPADPPPDPADALLALDEGSIGLAARFVAVAPGSFVWEGHKRPFSERDRCTVAVDEGFELQATEVTQLQYALVAGRNPSFFSRRRDCGEGEHRTVHGFEVCVNHPVDSVSRRDAEAFIDRLNQAQKTYTYRLPTEAEWQHAAASGGLSSPAEASAWYKENAGGRSHAVASKGASPLGVYDMAGNVWEWTHGPIPFCGKRGLSTEPASGLWAVDDYDHIRGGSWSHDFRVTWLMEPSDWLRSGMPGARRSSDIGFRLVRTRR